MSQQAPPKVVVVILNWNGWQDTLGCINSLQAINYANCRIVVVDNASTDESVVQLAQAESDITLLQSETNRGFAGGCNVGIRFALEQNADFIWLLNNDTEVTDNALSALVETARHEGHGITGSVLFEMHQRSTVQAWGGGWYSDLTAWCWNHRKPKPLRFITGASMLIARPVLQKAGLLDEDYFMYWEDIDYCRRALERGFTLGVAEDSQVYHTLSASVAGLQNEKHYYRGQSLALFFRKHSRLAAVPIVFGTLTRLFGRLIRLRASEAVAFLRGVLRGLRQSMGSPQKPE